MAVRVGCAEFLPDSSSQAPLNDGEDGFETQVPLNDGEEGFGKEILRLRLRLRSE